EPPLRLFGRPLLRGLGGGFLLGRFLRGLAAGLGFLLRFGLRLDLRRFSVEIAKALLARLGDGVGPGSAAEHLLPLLLRLTRDLREAAGEAARAGGRAAIGA